MAQQLAGLVEEKEKKKKITPFPPDIYTILTIMRIRSTERLINPTVPDCDYVTTW